MILCLVYEKKKCKKQQIFKYSRVFKAPLNLKLTFPEA